MWRYRRTLVGRPAALPKLLAAVDYTDPRSVRKMHALLAKWAPPSPALALQLLGGRCVTNQPTPNLPTHSPIDIHLTPFV